MEFMLRYVLLENRFFCWNSSYEISRRTYLYKVNGDDIRGHAQTTWTVRGGGGVGQMSTFVYVGGRGYWDNVYMVFFPYNFTQ